MIQPGNLFIYSAGGIEWLVVRNHTDDPELHYVLPLDVIPLQGAWDIPVEGSKVSSGVIRCGYGVWLKERTILEHLFHTDVLEPEYTQQAIDRLAQMVQGECPTGPMDDVDSPEYIDRCEVVSMEAAYLEKLEGIQQAFS